MKAKKRCWLNKIYHDSQESQSTEANISWSSSETSESENEDNLIVNGIKRLKAENNLTTSNKWNEIKQFIPETVNKFQNPEEKLLKVEQNQVCEQKCGDSNLYCHAYEESPIISKIDPNNISPVLANISANSDATKEVSPIIGKRNILKKIVLKKRQDSGRKFTLNCSDHSPDMFESESTQLIEHDSPLKQASMETCHISPAVESSCNVFQETRHIDTFLSQNSSLIVNYANYSESSSKTTTTSDDILYHMPAPKKRRYKKGGLAFLLQKTLRVQKNRLSIWQHEVYVKKKHFLEGIENVIRFEVHNIKREYGSSVLECFIKKSEKPCIESFSKGTNLELILMVISATVSFSFDVNNQYILFPPYECKILPYKSREVECYFNITKVIQS